MTEDPKIRFVVDRRSKFCAESRLFVPNAVTGITVHLEYSNGPSVCFEINVSPSFGPEWAGRIAAGVDFDENPDSAESETHIWVADGKLAFAVASNKVGGLPDLAGRLTLSLPLTAHVRAAFSRLQTELN